MYKLKKENILREIDDGYISRRKHPQCDLYILNYTPKCQYAWRWNVDTIDCRGIITDGAWNIIHKPFPKFFTQEQYKTLRCSVRNLYGVSYKDLYTGAFEVAEKLDGSLGIAYYNDVDKHWAIATRGSFESPQAIFATKILRDRYRDAGFLPNRTYLFEIIYPEKVQVIYHVA